MDFGHLEPLDGGWSGQTFVSQAGDERTVVRIYGGTTRGPEAQHIDAAVLQLVRGLVPVPAVLEARRPEGELPGLLITSFLPGVRGDVLLPALSAEQRATLGTHLGDLAADLAGMPFLTSGTFADADLRIDPVQLDLSDWIARHEAGIDLPPADWPRLRALAVDAQSALDVVDRVCLVHSDFNPKNLLIDPDSLRVTGLVDWEFAHAGHPFSDLGNLLRFDREPEFERAVLTAYVDRRGGVDVGADETLHLARCADLFALVELASRAPANPVAVAALQRLRLIARTGDVAATEA